MVGSLDLKLFGLLALAVGSVIVLLRPLWGVYLTLLLSPLQAFEFGSGPLSLSRMVGMGTMLALLIHSTARRKAFRLTGIEGPVYLMALGMSLSFLRTSETEGVALSILSLLSLYALVFLIVNLVEDEAQLKGLTLAFLASALYPTGLTISQWFQSPSYRSYHIVRVSGTFTKPTGLGGFLIPIVLMAFPLVIYPNASRRLRWLIMGLFGGAVVALVLSFSRSPWIGVIIGFGVFFFTPLFRGLSRRTRLSAVVGMGFLIGAIWVFWPLIEKRLLTPVTDLLTTGTSTESVLSRRYEFPTGVGIILDNHFLGTGIGNYGRDVRRYQQIYGTSLIPIAPHNIIFYFLGEVGIVGAAGFAWLLVWLYRRVKSHHQYVMNSAGNLTFYVYFGSLASLVGYVSYMAFHSGLFTNEIWIVVAFLIVTTRLAKASDQRACPRSGCYSVERNVSCMR